MSEEIITFSDDPDRDRWVAGQLKADEELRRLKADLLRRETKALMAEEQNIIARLPLHQRIEAGHEQLQSRFTAKLRRWGVEL